MRRRTPHVPMLETAQPVGELLPSYGPVAPGPQSSRAIHGAESTPVRPRRPPRSRHIELDIIIEAVESELAREIVSPRLVAAPSLSPRDGADGGGLRLRSPLGASPRVILSPLDGLSPVNETIMNPIVSGPRFFRDNSHESNSEKKEGPGENGPRPSSSGSGPGPTGATPEDGGELLTAGIVASHLEAALRWSCLPGDVELNAWYVVHRARGTPRHRSALGEAENLKILACQLLQLLRAHGYDVSGSWPASLAVGAALAFCRGLSAADDLGFFAYASLFSSEKDEDDADDPSVSTMAEPYLADSTLELLKVLRQENGNFFEAWILVHAAEVTRTTYLRVLQRAYCAVLRLGPSVVDPRPRHYETLQILCGSLRPEPGPRVQLMYESRVDGSVETQFVIPAWREEAEMALWLDELSLEEGSALGLYAAPTDTLVHERYDSVRKAFAITLPKSRLGLPDAWEGRYLKESFGFLSEAQAGMEKAVATGARTADEISFGDVWSLVRMLHQVIRTTKRVQWKGRLLIPREVVHPGSHVAAEQEANSTMRESFRSRVSSPNKSRHRRQGSTPRQPSVGSLESVEERPENSNEESESDLSEDEDDHDNGDPAAPFGSTLGSLAEELDGDLQMSRNEIMKAFADPTYHERFMSLRYHMMDEEEKVPASSVPPPLQRGRTMRTSRGEGGRRAAANAAQAVYTHPQDDTLLLASAAILEDTMWGSHDKNKDARLYYYSPKYILRVMITGHAIGKSADPIQAMLKGPEILGAITRTFVGRQLLRSGKISNWAEIGALLGHLSKNATYFAEGLARLSLRTYFMPGLNSASFLMRRVQTKTSSIPIEHSDWRACNYREMVEGLADWYFGLGDRMRTCLDDILLGVGDAGARVGMAAASAAEGVDCGLGGIATSMCDPDLGWHVRGATLAEEYNDPCSSMHALFMADACCQAELRIMDVLRIGPRIFVRANRSMGADRIWSQREVHRADQTSFQFRLDHRHSIAEIARTCYFVTHRPAKAFECAVVKMGCRGTIESHLALWSPHTMLKFTDTGGNVLLTAINPAESVRFVPGRVRRLRPLANLFSITKRSGTWAGDPRSFYDVVRPAVFVLYVWLMVINATRDPDIDYVDLAYASLTGVVVRLAWYEYAGIRIFDWFRGHLSAGKENGAVISAVVTIIRGLAELFSWSSTTVYVLAALLYASMFVPLIASFYIKNKNTMDENILRADLGSVDVYEPWHSVERGNGAMLPLASTDGISRIGVQLNGQSTRLYGTRHGYANGSYGYATDLLCTSSKLVKVG